MLDANFSSVDKYVRGIQGLESSITPEVLSMKFLSRPFRTDLQRVRAIFIWIVENISYVGPEVERQRVKRGITASDLSPSVRPDLETAESTLRDRCCTRDGFALLFHSMASAAGVHCGIVRGYLKCK
jgi:transglutaminase/protease-like cytokinesis protein 3